MAYMIPKLNTKLDFKGRYGERIIYEALEKLDDQFVIFHSIGWKSKQRGFEQGESDFLIYHPTRGLLVIEAKGGIIRSEMGVWYQKNQKTNQEHKLKRSPIEQADSSRFRYREHLIENDVDTYVCSAIWLTSMSKPPVKPQYSMDIREEQVFWRDDLETPLDAINKCFDSFSVPKTQKYDKEKRKIIMDLFAPRFNVLHVGQDKIDYYNSAFSRMTNEQVRILDFLVDQREAAIMGGAGTGKTLLAKEQVRRLSKNGKVLFLCFNMLLRKHLSEVFSDNKEVEVHNMQTLTQSIIRKRNTLFEDEEISDVLDEAALNSWSFDHIVIDEGQDFNPDHIMYLKNIAEINEGYFYVFYDKNQIVQQRSGIEWVDEIACRLNLTVNCRNTKSIAKTSYAPLNIENQKFKSVIEGKRTSFRIVRGTQQDLVEDLESIIRKYIEKGYKRGNITILSMKSMQEHGLEGLSKIGNSRLSEEYREESAVFVSTARRFKGLESEIVIIIDLDEHSFLNDEERRLFYVAASRAKVELNILFNDTSDKFPEFAKRVIGRDSSFIFPEFQRYMGVEIQK